MPTLPTCTDQNLRVWNRVPDGSRLEVSVVGHPDPKDDQFVANAEARITNDVTEEWTDEMLRPGPKKRKLASPRGYNVTVRVAFATADTAQVQSRVVKPDGSVFGKVHCHTMSGKAGDILACTLIAITQK